jgi:transcriptional regulator with XRE-family HTH domain
MSADWHDAGMGFERVGPAFRAVRLRRNWTQAELARRARVSRKAVIDLENGRLGRLSFDAMEGIAKALDGQLDIRFRWRGEELDRLLNHDHSAMHEQVAQLFAPLSDWVLAPEVSFAIYAERGVIDLLAFHRPSRRLLVIELKTLIVDVQQLLSVTDRYRRLATQIARQRWWDPVGVSLWLIIADSRTNRRRIEAHRTVLRAAFPSDGRSIRSWLAAPDVDLAVMSTIATPAAGHGRPMLAGRKRASKPRGSAKHFRSALSLRRALAAVTPVG